MPRGSSRIDAATAYWTVGERRGELREQTLPAPVAGEVLVRALHSGISRGTEMLVHRGRVPASQYSRMRAPMQQGDFPWPVKYGYSSVGIVEAGEPDWVGRTVFCLHPHQDRYVVPLDWAHPLPVSLPPARAVLAANMETALNGLWDAAPRVGDRIAVVGAGVVGMLAAWLASGIAGSQVEVIDPAAGRAEVARELGLSWAPSAARARLHDADLVIHASGTAAGLADALALAGFEATVLELSWYGDQSVSAPLGEAFHSRRLCLRSSQVGAVASAQRARWDARRRMQLALSLLADDRLDAMISGVSRFADLPDTMRHLDAATSAPLMQRIDYD